MKTGINLISADTIHEVMITNKSELSTDFKVAIYINECNLHNEPVWFSKIVQGTGLSRQEISVALDRLFDLCILDGEWERVNGKWTRTFRVTDPMNHYFTALASKPVSP